MIVPRRSCATAVAVLAAALLTAGAARAADPEPAAITAAPTIAGTPQEGSSLTATATWTGDPAPTVAWAWLRCADAAATCAEIPSATSDTYVPTTDDVGQVLRVQLTVTNDSGTDQQVSAPTDPVLAAPGVPPPDPTPTPTPPPTITPSATPAPTVASLAPVAPPRPLRPLRPFPVVRIKGELTATGARITLLTVRAPRGSLIAARCRGRGCPRPRRVRAAALVRLRAFERPLLAGVRLEVTVTSPRRIGKWTLIVIRRGAFPKRRDGCLAPITMRHMRCPLG